MVLETSPAILSDMSRLKRTPRVPWVYGQGINKGVAGRPITIVVDMRYTRAGHMTCTCQTPSGKLF